MMHNKYHPEMDGKELMTREEFKSAFSQGQGSGQMLMGDYKMPKKGMHKMPNGMMMSDKEMKKMKKKM